MATSTLNLYPKGKLAPTMFNRATVLRHTNTHIPKRACIVCSAYCAMGSKPCSPLQSVRSSTVVDNGPSHSVVTKRSTVDNDLLPFMRRSTVDDDPPHSDKPSTHDDGMKTARLSANRKKSHQADHQCFFCDHCMDKGRFPETAAITVRSSQDILSARLRGKPPKADGRSTRSNERTAILTASLTRVDHKGRACGFCARSSASTRLVRFCVDCKRYLCGGCYKKHQSAESGKNWMYRYHATIDLAEIRNPDVM